MSLNSLKIATDGYLKRTTKAVLIIAVAGYLNFGGTPPIPSDGGGGKPKHHVFEQINTLEEIINQDKEIIALIKIFLECRKV